MGLDVWGKGREECKAFTHQVARVAAQEVAKWSS